MTPLSIAGFSDPFSSLTHLCAAVASLIGAVFLYRRGRGNSARVFSLMLYSFSLAFLFSMSGVFHMLDRGGVAREVLQRLDHAGIWTLIAGTFTPIHMILFRRHWRWAILCLVWALAITALVLEIVFFHGFPESLLVSLFLSLGWIGAISGILFRQTFRDPSVKLLISGGIFYSLGAVIDFAKWPTLISGVIGPHEIFHVFVILGALAHWRFVYRWCHHPVRNQITFDVHMYPSSRYIARWLEENIEIHADSLEEMRRLVRESVSRKYHSTIQPQIRLRYQQVEFL